MRIYYTGVRGSRRLDPDYSLAGRGGDLGTLWIKAISFDVFSPYYYHRH